MLLHGLPGRDTVASRGSLRGCGCAGCPSALGIILTQGSLPLPSKCSLLVNSQVHTGKKLLNYSGMAVVLSGASPGWQTPGGHKTPCWGTGLADAVPDPEEGWPYLPGSPGSIRFCLPFQGAGRHGRAWGWHHGMPRAWLFPTCPLSRSLPATAPGGGCTPEPPAAPREEHMEEHMEGASLCWAQIRRHRRVSKVYFTQRVGGDKTVQKLYSHRDLFTTNIIPKVTAWQRGVGTAANVSAHLYTHPELCWHRGVHGGATAASQGWTDPAATSQYAGSAKGFKARA